MATVEGFDVSKWQGKVDFGKAAASGKKFVFIKASEGVGYIDPRFKENWKRAKEAGLLVGAYHFARVSMSPTIEEDARSEAEWFWKMIEEVGGMGDGVLPPVLDIEWDKRAKDENGKQIPAMDVVRWCLVFLARLEELAKVTPIVYTGYNFWKFRLAKTKELARFQLWLVQYTKKPKPYKPIPGWKWKFWQWSHTRPIPGVPGKGVDENRFDGTLIELKGMASVKEAPPVVVVPTVPPRVISPPAVTTPPSSMVETPKDPVPVPAVPHIEPVSAWGNFITWLLQLFENKKTDTTGKGLVG